jgi:hypothetical protein
MFDAIAFKHEVTAGSRTYLEWEGTFQSNNIAGLTVLTKDAAGLIESIRVYYRPYNVVVAFSADLGGRLAGNMTVDPFLGSTLREHPYRVSSHRRSGPPPRAHRKPNDARPRRSHA